MQTLTPHQLTTQALVLFVDAGKYAMTTLDEIEEFDSKSRQAEIDEENGMFDDMAMPEGMNLHEMSLGVVPLPPTPGGGPADA